MPSITKNKLTTEIHAGEIEYCLSIITSSKNIDQELLNQANLLTFRYNDLVRQDREGLISTEDLSNSKNKIVQSILSLINDLPNHLLLDSSEIFNEKKIHSKTKNDGKTFKQTLKDILEYIGLLKGLGGLSILGFIGFLIVKSFSFKIKGCDFDLVQNGHIVMTNDSEMYWDCNAKLSIKIKWKTNKRKGALYYRVIVNESVVFEVSEPTRAQKGQAIIPKEIPLTKEYINNQSTIKVRVAYDYRPLKNSITNYWSNKNYEGEDQSVEHSYKCAQEKRGMRFVQGGTIQLGDRLIETKSFYMDINEVSYEEWVQDIDAPSVSYHDNYPYSQSIRNKSTSECPIVLISWEDAMSFCKRKNKRLPTKSEWIYAALGGIYFDPPLEFANQIYDLKCNNNRCYVNKLGIMNLTCNAKEWCFDGSDQINKYVVGGHSVDILNFKKIFDSVNRNKASSDDSKLGFRGIQKISSY